MDFPITCVVFYDSKIYTEQIMENLAQKLLDVFIYKFKFHLERNSYRDFSPTNPIYTSMSLSEIGPFYEWTENPATTFEAALPLILEDVSSLIRLIVLPPFRPWLSTSSTCLSA